MPDEDLLEPLDAWSDEFRACLGAWEEEITRPPQGRLTDPLNPKSSDERKEAIHAV